MISKTKQAKSISLCSLLSLQFESIFAPIFTAFMEDKSSGKNLCIPSTIVLCVGRDAKASSSGSG